MGTGASVSGNKSIAMVSAFASAAKEIESKLLTVSVSGFCIFLAFDLIFLFYRTVMLHMRMLLQFMKNLKNALVPLKNIFLVLGMVRLYMNLQ